MPPNNNVQYLAINDFSPGIVADYRAATGAGAGVPPAILEARKPGEAAYFQSYAIPADQGGGNQAFYTRGFYANDQGHLVPLPVLNPTAFLQLPAFGTDTFVDIAGFTVTPNVNVDDLWTWEHVVVAGAPNHDAMKVFRGTTLIKTHQGPGAVAGPSRGITHVLSRGKRSGFATPGGPELFWEWTSGEPHTDGSVYFYDVFPDPNATNTDTTYEETATIANAAFTLGGQIVGHDGRILRLCEQAHDFGTHKFFSNERVRNTDPPNAVSLTATTTDSIVDPQNPNSFGAWGSLTYGELLLIKQSGGALLVEGDIYAPQITRLPGVQSTGQTVSETASCAAGLVYMTDDGPYLWQGGSQSHRLGYPGGAIQVITANQPASGGSGISCSVQQFNNLVVFSGGVVYDAIHGSWWALQIPYANNSPSISFFGTSTINPGNLYGVTQGAGASGRIEVWQWRPSNYTANVRTTATWLSQPIATGYDTIDITSVEISIGNVTIPPANISISIYFVTIDGTMRFCGTFSPNPASGIPDGTWRFRTPVGVRARNIQPYISCTNTHGDPIVVNEIIIGYTDAGRFGRGNQVS